MILLLQILGLILLTDFITGIIHWWEDSYANPNWKYLGKSIAVPNIEHHKYPRKFLQGTMIDRIKFSVITAFVVGIFLFFMGGGGLNWQTIFVLIYGSFGNEFHAIAHRTDKENGKIICLFQKLGLMQSRKMHGQHHTSPYEINYCVMTNYLNPFLNYIGFWQKLEKIISLLGIKPIRNENIREGV